MQPRSNDEENHPQKQLQSTVEVQGKKIGSELQNANGNFKMVKMNGKTLLIRHLIIFKSYLLL